MTDANWKACAEIGGLQAVLDPSDKAGHKNRYLDLLQKKVLDAAIGDKVTGKLVLDVGCGVGRFNQFLWDREAKVIGIDTCKEMLDKNMAPTVLSPVTDIDFDTNYFDAALSVGTLQYIPSKDLKQAAAEISRVVKPFGYIFIIEQLSENGYDHVHPRYWWDYYQVFRMAGCNMETRRPVTYAFDRIIDAVRIGLIPEFLHGIIADLHLEQSENQPIRKDGYTDYFMMFRKVG